MGVGRLLFSWVVLAQFIHSFIHSFISDSINKKVNHTLTGE